MRLHEITRRSAKVREGTNTIKPNGSLDADQWRRKSERMARVQQQMRDENERHGKKLRDLRSRTQ